MGKHRHSKVKILILLIMTLAIAFTVFYLLSGGHLFKLGEVTYDASLNDDERSFLDSVLKNDNVKLKYDVHISATTEDSPATNETSLLFDAMVPVADFYYAESNIQSASLNSANTEVELISIHDVKPTQKMLSLDGSYFFDTFDSGAKFRILHFDGKQPQEALQLVEPQIEALPNSENTLSFTQTGVTAASRRMNTKLESVGNASFFAEKIKDFFTNKDLVHTSNESSFSNYATAENICSKPEMIDLLTSINLNIVELTGNHNQDCGNDDAIATIDKYNSLDIQVVGGGKNAEEAANPLNIEQKNTKITMLGYNLSTGGYTTDNNPGANLYTAEKGESDIKSAKTNGDFVIVDIQYFECNEYDVTTESTACDAPISGQREFFQHLVDLGADIVVGTSAHQPQTYELYNDGVIYYGLGNLFFDQSWWPGTRRSLMLTHFFVNGQLKQTRITPTVYDDNYQTTLMDEDTATWFIDRLNQAR